MRNPLRGPQVFDSERIRAGHEPVCERNPKNRFTCDKCKKRRKCVKKLTIHRWPKILVVSVAPGEQNRMWLR